MVESEQSKKLKIFFFIKTIKGKREKGRINDVFDENWMLKKSQDTLMMFSEQ